MEIILTRLSIKKLNILTLIKYGLPKRNSEAHIYF
jgi:hypothetical protein